MQELYKHFKIRFSMPGTLNLMKAFLLLVFLCPGLSMYAQQYVTTTASVSGGNSFPFNSTTSNKVEMTYGPAEFTTAPKGGYIKTVYFRFTTVAAATYSNFTISMAQVSSVTATTTYTTPVSTCYGPSTLSMSPSVGVWYAIKLTTPFLYNPKLILVVTVQMSAGTGNSIGYTTSTLARGRLWGAYGSATGTGNDNERYDFGMDVAPAGNNNAGVSTLVSPVAFCPGTYGIQVKAANFGQNALTSVNVGWSFDGVTQTPVSWPYTIPSGRDTTVTLGTQTFAANVNHVLKAWTYNPNSVKDTTPGDDTLLVKTLVPAVSGTFTINPSLPAGGTNFTSFTSAANFINAAGVCGPVLFKVSPGTYTDQVTLNNVVGTSSTNTITFDGGDSTKTILTTSTSGDAFKISGTNYVTLKRLGIYNNSTTSPSFAVHITGGSAYNTVTGCIVKVDTNTTVAGVTALGICGSTYSATDGAHHNTIFNNIMAGGYITISCYGSGNTAAPTPGNLINKNRITRGYQYSMYFQYQRDYSISNNVVISRPNPTVSAYGLYVYYCANGILNANVISSNYCGIYANYSDYYVTGKISTITNNMVYGQYYASGGYGIYSYYGINSTVQHNTIYYTATGSGYGFYIYNTGTLSQGTDVRNNIVYKTNSSAYCAYIPSLSYCSYLDYNDFYSVGGNYVYFGSTAYADLPSLQKASALYNQNTINADPGFANLTYGAENLHMAKTSYGVSGIYGGVNTDFDGDARCKLFPNMGADETLNGKGKPVVKFFITSNLYPGSPSLVYQTYKAGSPTKNQWYIINSSYGNASTGTWYKIPHALSGDSVVLKTTLLTVGANCLKLVTQTCGGNDSFQQCFNVTAPTAVPVTDFVANKNSIVTGDIVTFQDLSSNGPQTWTWKVSPDSTVSGGSKVPAIKYIFGGAKAQNPQIQFMFPGKYQICLTSSNGVGKGATVCKKDYITVLPTVNMSATITKVTNAAGYLYDDGGPTAPYINNGGAPSMLIAPCADSVYLVFSMFDLNCNISFMQLYEGVDAKGKRLDPCGGSGLNSGLTGGPSGAVCGSPCMPNVTKPDTFKASKSMFIQMNDGSASANAKGFAAYWWSKPSSSKKPKAGFTQSGSGDSVCTNAQVNFVNTSSTNNANDPVTVLWDLDGDNTSYECIGTCATAFWPYFLAGPVSVTMIATNCGGSDTFVKTLTVYNPKTPKAQLLADNTTPTTADLVFFTAPIAQCVEDYTWTFTKSAGSGSGVAQYMNGTSSTSPSPQVIFSDTGYYDVSLAVANMTGSQKDNITLKKYVHVRAPYCVPSVATLNQGMGISQVTLNTINNSMTQSTQEYTNFTSNQGLSTSLAVGASYTMTISRNPNLVFENLNRSVFIDWNGDGSFTGTGELAASDSNSSTVTWVGKIKVPKTAKLGATIMRIAVNRGAYSNKPCGQNEFGEYQDYRVYIVPYTILPVITLKGQQGLKDTIKIEQGSPFVETGYSASSFLYGNMTSQVKETSRRLGSVNPADSFNNLVPGIYIFSYNVKDSSGNKAITQNRVVQVYKDKTAPVLIVAGPDTTVLEVTASPLTPFPAPKVISADDFVDGPLVSNVINDANKVTSNILGTYTITYTVSDLTGNTSTVYRYVKIIDTLKPVITLLGTSPVSLQVKTGYTDAGVSLSDNYYGASILTPLLSSVSTLDPDKIGSYTITYNLTDPSGNKAKSVTRIINVIDTLKPVISLIGPATDSMDVFTKYDDPGVDVSDNYYGSSDVSITKTGSFYTKFPANTKANITGVYIITYTATDKSGNSASVNRTVKVQDHIAPVFVLIGSPTVTVCRWFHYTDAGYTVSDNYDKATLIKVDTLTTGNTMIDGLYSIQYVGTDASGNVGKSEYRYVLVNPTSSPGCTSGIETGLGLDKYIKVFPNPNNGMFSIAANLPAAEKIHITVTNVLGQQIAVIHDGILDQNSFQVDLSNQVSGMYFINFVSGSETLSKRIEITK